MIAATELARVGRALGAIQIRAWRLHLETPGVLATVPMLRGVWEAASRALSPTAYDRVFAGGESGIPRYLLRPAAREVRPTPAIEFLVFGEPGAEADEAIWSAWDRACEMGLGPDRGPFRIRATIPLAWDRTPLRPAHVQPGFTPAPLPWPLDGRGCGCRGVFPALLRLIHQRRLVARPTPADLAVAALRRIQALAPDHPNAAMLWAARRDWIEMGRSIPCGPWEGRRLDVTRSSGSQQAELVLRGVAGSLAFPTGLGPLAPCRRLALPEPTIGTAQLYCGQAGGLLVRLPDWLYPIVIDTESGTIRYDNYSGTWGEEQHLDRFLQAYAVERAAVVDRLEDRLAGRLDPRHRLAGRRVGAARRPSGRGLP